MTSRLAFLGITILIFFNVVGWLFSIANLRRKQWVELVGSVIFTLIPSVFLWFSLRGLWGIGWGLLLWSGTCMIACLIDLAFQRMKTGDRAIRRYPFP